MSSLEEPVMTRSFGILPALCLAAIPCLANAHHSWRTDYEGGEEVTVNAVVTSAVFRNPHLSVNVEITNDAGDPEAWLIEWRGQRRGDGEPPVQYDLGPGDEVVIAGRIARDPSRKRIQMRSLARPADGMTIETRNRDERNPRG
jgi:hypothetical protein